MSGHIHEMRPVRKGYGYSDTVYGCISCAFRCTKGVVSQVNKSPKSHKAISKTDPQAKIIWDGK